MYEDSISEKDSYVIKISKLESSLDNLKKKYGTVEKKSTDQVTVSTRYNFVVEVRNSYQRVFDCK